MSNEKQTDEKRLYRKRRRAQQEDETRRRITEATVDLHGSVGPAQTTISAVADRAGVQRSTVYRHFPDEESLFAACSSHWIASHPLPDLEKWAEIEDPKARLGAALEQLYGWFDRGEYMLEKTTRDVVTVAALRPSMELFGAWLEGAADVLIAGRGDRGKRRRLARAAIGHALSFETWRSLVRVQQLDQGSAIALMAALVEAASAR